MLTRDGLVNLAEGPTPASSAEWGTSGVVSLSVVPPYGRRGAVGIMRCA